MSGNSTDGDRIALGIDLGGTKVRTGAVTESGEVLGEGLLPTEAGRESERVFANIVRSAEQACQNAGLNMEDVWSVGIGSPAPLDLSEGVIVSPGNLPSLHGFPMVERLQEALGKPVVLNNDGNCFGLAEARYGAGQGAEVCCGLTLGTGLGCAVVMHGRIYSGPGGAAAEIWCSPHGDEIVEEAVSGRGVARSYTQLTGRETDAADIADRARKGDKEAIQAYRQFGRDLAVPLAYVCNVLDPDVVVLGGSLSRAHDLFGEAMEAHAREYINEINRRRLRIVRAALGDDAGVLGAAALPFSEL